MSNTNGRYSVEQVIQAVHDTKGLVSLTAKRLGCVQQTVRNYISRYATVKQALRDEREAMLDVGELSLFNAVQNGEAWAVCFWLKTQGKHRGYVERQEVDHSGSLAASDGDYERVAGKLARLIESA